MGSHKGRHVFWEVRYLSQIHRSLNRIWLLVLELLFWEGNFEAELCKFVKSLPNFYSAIEAGFSEGQTDLNVLPCYWNASIGFSAGEQSDGYNLSSFSSWGKEAASKRWTSKWLLKCRWCKRTSSMQFDVEERPALLHSVLRCLKGELIQLK